MRTKIILIYLAILFIAVILIYFFMYNIYGSIIKKSTDYLYADYKSEIIIEVIPINALATKALFRKSSAKFEIIDGNNLVDIINMDEEKGLLKIRAKDKTGKVSIKIKSQHSLFPELLEIEILPLTA